MLNFNKVYFVLFPASVLCNCEELQKGLRCFLSEVELCKLPCFDQRNFLITVNTSGKLTLLFCWLCSSIAFLSGDLKFHF